jgi:hypothetical protein
MKSLPLTSAQLTAAIDVEDAHAFSGPKEPAAANKRE